MDDDIISALSSLILLDTLVTLFTLTVSLGAERAKAVVLVTMFFRSLLLALTLFSFLMAERRPLMLRL